MEPIAPRTNAFYHRFIVSFGTNMRYMLEDVQRQGLRSHIAQIGIAFFVGASFLLPVVAVSGVAHNADQKERTAQFQMQEAQIEDLKHTVDLAKQDVAALQTQNAQQKMTISTQQTQITQKDATITSQAQQLDSVKNGLQKAEDNPIWKIVLDAVIQFLINMGCDWLRGLLLH